jgi:pantoate--beta-alanine ligase
MQVFNTKTSLETAFTTLRNQKLSIGLVPTMGALHNGHLSLVRMCRKNNDITIASIYVNPTQFNDKTDLKNTRVFDFDQMGAVMEGKHRPGHFNGVAQIITKLFDIIQPNRAYFGQKDFQQLAIIRKLATDLHYPVEIIGCPIIREADGLAMSSRNQLLTPEHRKAAPLIYQTLRAAKKMAGNADIPAIKRYVDTIINHHPLLKLEYFQIVESDTLKSLKYLTPRTASTACIAVFAGSVRLIDNIDLFS